MHIVTLGSGTGQAMVLRGIRAYACRVTAIVGVTDNGGHSGQLRRILHLPQVGDTRQCLNALLDDESVWATLLRHRFRTGELRGLSVGNLILAALAERHGSLQAAVEAIRGAAHLASRVLPVSDGNAQIGAELEDGRVVVGEWQIIQRQPRSAVVRLFLQPQIAAHPAVLEAIAAADVLVYCPGSLLTGLLSVLLAAGLREAIAASQATALYVCNLMTQPGQTDALTAAQHLALLQQSVGRHVDAVLLNNGPLPPKLLHLYASYGAFPVVDDLKASAVPIYRADLVEHPDPETLATYARSHGTDMQVGLHLMRHDAGKLAAQIMALVPACGSPMNRQTGD